MEEVLGRVFGDAAQTRFEDVISVQECHFGVWLDPDLVLDSKKNDLNAHKKKNGNKTTLAY